MDNDVEKLDFIDDHDYSVINEMFFVKFLINFSPDDVCCFDTKVFYVTLYYYMLTSIPFNIKRSSKNPKLRTEVIEGIACLEFILIMLYLLMMGEDLRRNIVRHIR